MRIELHGWTFFLPLAASPSRFCSRLSSRLHLVHPAGQQVRRVLYSLPYIRSMEDTSSCLFAVHGGGCASAGGRALFPHFSIIPGERRIVLSGAHVSSMCVAHKGFVREIFIDQAGAKNSLSSHKNNKKLKTETVVFYGHSMLQHRMSVKSVGSD